MVWTQGSTESVCVTVESGCLEDLDRRADEWNQLSMTSGENLPMLSHAWVSAYLATCLRPGEHWTCLFAHVGTRLVGVMPLVHVAHKTGSRLRAPSDSQTAFAHPLLNPGSEVETLDALLRSLMDIEPRPLWIRFYGVRDKSPLWQALGSAASPMLVTSPLTTSGSRLDTQGSFETYETGLDGNFRRNLRKARNRSQRDFRVKTDFVTGARAAEPALFEQLLHMEASGWKGTAGTAIACSNQMTDFYRILVQRLAAHGMLEWQVMSFDEEAVAMHLAVRSGTALALPKIAYNESFARYSPGNILLSQTLSRAFSDPTVEEINCLTDMPWHGNWHMSQAVYLDVMLTPRRIWPMAASFIGGLEPRARAYAAVRNRPTALRSVRAIRRAALGVTSSIHRRNDTSNQCS